MQHVGLNRFVHRCVRAGGLLVLLGLVAAAPGMAQDSSPPAVPTPIPQPTPIPLPDIPARAADAADTARQTIAGATPDSRLQEIQNSLPAEQERIKDLREDTDKQLKRSGPAAMINETEKSWVRIRDRLDRWLADLAARSGALNSTVVDLQARISLWSLTRDQESVAALPKTVRQQIADTISILDDAEKQVRSARDAVLDLQTSVAQAKSDVDSMLVTVQQEIGTRAKGVVAIDSPPLWRAFGVDGDARDVLDRFESTRHEHWQNLQSYIAEQREPLLIWALIWVGLAIFMIAMRRKAEVWTQQDASLKSAVTLLGRPVSSALVLTALLNTLLEPRAPGVWTDVLGFVVVLAMVRLLPDLLPKSLRLVPSLVVLLYLLWRIVKFVPEGFLIHRLALLALAGGGFAILWWLNTTLKGNPDLLPKKWHQPTSVGVRVGLVSFAVGAVADVVGSVEFSTILLTGTAATALAAVFWWFIAVTLQSIVRVALLTETARRWGVAPAHSDTVRTTVFRIIDFWSVVGWLAVSMKGFLLLDSLTTNIRRVFDWSLSIGSFSIGPGDFLIFAFFFWLSFKIADFVQFIFTVDVVPRVDLPKGIPETISRLTRYAIITVGAVIASAAAGFDISKVSIILGGLGVGVGFGLQNIVNNFVSGLILLFERPIRVGDTLDIDDTGGTVERIGMRASVVATWDGAEVVVPNAHLISEDVVNWTLTHDRRRMVIPIGVSYDADPEQAAEIIVGVANDHKDVDRHPDPACLFVGFGDSSLDFELRAWTAGSNYMGVASDLRFAIVRKLREAGIEIPFPQRDIHMRSSEWDAPRVVEPKNLPDDPSPSGAGGADPVIDNPPEKPKG